jgi:hypothetical protein
LLDVLADFQRRFSLGPGFEISVRTLVPAEAGATGERQKQQGSNGGYELGGRFHKSMVDCVIA